MTSTPVVSVLVTVYNREAFLEQSVRSILASSYSDFEIIIVDDCSSDRSVDVAKSLEREDRRIRVVENCKNLGDYGNRKKAASLARGRFLKYVDSDDIIYPHSLQLMVDVMQSDDSVSAALSHALPGDDQPYPWKLSPLQAYQKHFNGRGCLACGPTGAIIRKSAYDTIGGFRPEWKVLSDLDLWFRLATCWPVVLLPPGLTWWRRHAGQEYSNPTAKMIYLEYGYRLTTEMLDNPDCPLPLEERRSAVSRMRQHHARRLVALATKGKSPGIAWNLFRKSRMSLGELALGLKPYE